MYTNYIYIYIYIYKKKIRHFEQGTTQSLPGGELAQEADPIKLWMFSIVYQMFMNSIHSFVDEKD